MKGSETRERIFRAAMKVAARDGLLTVTLDNVAEESGLSKGGVIHHFSTKEALLSGVIMHFTDRVEAQMTKLVADDPNPTFRWVRAMLALMAAERKGVRPSKTAAPTGEMLEQFMLSVLAATVHNPELAKPIQAIGQRLRGRLTSVPEEGLEQLILWLVMDGLFLWQFVGMLAPDDPLIDQVHQNLSAKLQSLSGPPQSADRRPGKVRVPVPQSGKSRTNAARAATRRGGSHTGKNRRRRSS